MAIIKTCNTCNESKDSSLFRKTGLQCLSCFAEYSKKYREKNKQILNLKQREKWANRSEEEKIKEQARGRERHYKDHEKQLLRGKYYYQRNREKVIKRQSAHNSANREAMNLRLASWRKRNPEKAKSAKVAYYSRLKKIPSWADKNKIEQIYAEAKRLRLSGYDCHVDHIVPLRGRLASGLHVETNLRIISAKDNLTKSAKLLDI